ncbi:MAG: L,D-transpeptidase family protein, partial [Acutalibacteraceae bacterium]
HHLFGNVDGQYVTGITGDILFHSVPYESASPNTLETEEYNNLGKSVSMGCVRLAVADAKWIYKNCKRGTTVEIYDGKVSSPLGKPNSMHINSSENWDPTDDSRENPYRDRGPVITGVKIIRVNKGTDKKDINFLKGIKAKDTCKNDITKRVKYYESADFDKEGVYTIVYKVQDDMKRTNTLYGKIIVE